MKKRQVFAFLLVCLILFSNADIARADIKKIPGLQVADEGITLDSKYTFMPKFTSKSKMTPFGSGWKRLQRASYEKGWYQSFDGSVSGSSSKKGKIGVLYSNVGHYNGKSIDLKITVNDWKNYFNNNRATPTIRGYGYISFAEKDIAVLTQGYEYVDMTWEYVETGTDRAVPVSGYFTFSDIDVQQAVEFHSSTSRSIDNFIIKDRTNKLQYKSNSGKYYIYDTTDYDIDETGGYDYYGNVKHKNKSTNIKDWAHRYAFTFTYSNLSSLRFRWITDWANTDRGYGKGFPNNGRASNQYRPTNPDGEYFFYVPNKPARTNIPSPTKSVNRSSLTTTQKLEYNIAHDIPNEDPKYYYSSYKLVDKLDKAIKNPKVTITQDGTNRNSWFSISTSGNTVTATATSSALKNKDFYGGRFNVKITGDINANNLSGSTYTINNSATVTVNGTDYNTNKVSSTISRRNVTINHIDDSSGKTITSESLNLYDGQSYSAKRKSNLKSGDKVYKYLRGEKSGTVNGKNISVNLYYTLPRDVTVQHIDKITNKIIKEEVKSLYDGDSYSYSPRTDLKRSDGYSYKPLDGKKSGKVNGNTTIKFYYAVPKIDTSLDNLRIYTNKISEKLPAEINMETSLGEYSEIKDFDGAKIKFTIKNKENNNELYSEIFDIKDTPSKHNFDIKTTGLTKGQKVDLEVKLKVETNGKNNYEVNSKDDLDTHAYTSEEKTITNFDKFTGVVVTDKSLNKDVKEYKETYQVKPIEEPRVKSGYGYNIDAEVVYTNELISEVTDKLKIKHTSKPEILIDSIVVDLAQSDLDSNKSGNNFKHNMLEKITMGDSARKITGNYSLPETYLDRKDGVLYLEDVSGRIAIGNRLLVPVWIDELGKYDFTFRSQNAVGSHSLKFNIGGKIDVYAYMFNHHGSETSDIDEILIHPKKTR